MAFGFAGAGAGAAKALEEILGEQMLRARLAQQQKEAAAQLALQTRQVEGIEADRATNRALQTRQRDLAEQQYRDEQAQQATDRNIGMDASNVMGLPGMDDAAKSRELTSSVLRNPTASSAPAMLRVIEGLTKPPARDPIADHEAKAKIDAKYRPKPTGPAAPKTPLWVKQADGTIVDLNRVAPPGSRPIDAVADRQQAAVDDNSKRAVEAMRAFGDDMLSVIDTLIDEQGNLKPEVAGVIGGFQGARPEWAYATEGSQGALANIDRLQSMLNIDTLRDMKSQSRTGATGFGALSERELNVVESSASKLRRRRQGDPEYAAELKRLRDTIKAGRGAAPQGKGQGETVVGDALDAMIERLRKPKG